MNLRTLVKWPTRLQHMLAKPCYLFIVGCSAPLLSLLFSTSVLAGPLGLGDGSAVSQPGNDPVNQPNLNRPSPFNWRQPTSRDRIIRSAPSTPQNTLSPGQAARKAQRINGGGHVLAVTPVGKGYRVKLIHHGEVRVIYVPGS